MQDTLLPPGPVEATALRSYAADVAHVARSAIYPMVLGGSIDGSARGRDDYQAELWVTAWQSLAAYRQRYAGVAEGERDYVLKAVWNRSRDLQRQAWRSRDRHAVAVQSALTHPATHDAHARLEARSALRALASRLSEGDKDLLERVHNSGGARAVANQMRIPATSLQREVHRARVRAHQILETTS